MEPTWPLLQDFLPSFFSFPPSFPFFPSFLLVRRRFDGFRVLLLKESGRNQGRGCSSLLFFSLPLGGRFLSPLLPLSPLFPLAENKGENVMKRESVFAGVEDYARTCLLLNSFFFSPPCRNGLSPLFPPSPLFLPLCEHRWGRNRWRRCATALVTFPLPSPSTLSSPPSLLFPRAGFGKQDQ